MPEVPPDVQRLCDEFDVRIVPKHILPMPGETRAPATIERILRKHGESHLRFVLSTIAETKGTGGLLTEVTLWAVSDLVRACPQWADERTSDWLEAWDRMPFGEMIVNIYELGGIVSQRAALAGAVFHWLCEELKTDGEDEPARIHMRYLSDDDRIKVGLQLLSIKRQLPRGHFGPWLRDRPDISKGMAQKLMRLARAANGEEVDEAA